MTLRMCRQKVAVRLLAVGAALVGAAAMWASPIRADMINNAFLAALTNAGVAYSEPASTTALGQSVCPMLVAQGGAFYPVAFRMGGANGMSPEAAGLFTLIAVATYCPALMWPLVPRLAA